MSNHYCYRQTNIPGKFPHEIWSSRDINVLRGPWYPGKKRDLWLGANVGKYTLNLGRAKAQEDRKELGDLPRGKGETVLIVDDEESICDVSSHTLETFGYRTLIAHNGAEAVTIYEQLRDKISAVVTDMSMPVMDGPATIQALKKINPAVKIIASSGRSTRESLADAGTKYFLNKPYTAETLLRVLRQILDDI